MKERKETISLTNAGTREEMKRGKNRRGSADRKERQGDTRETVS